MTVHTPLEPHDPHAVGRYTLIGRLGEGGQGVVYLAENGSGRKVAVKVLHDKPERYLNDRRRFAREVRALQQLNERCTAPILDFNLDAKQPYLVSEYVDGPSLWHRVKNFGPLGQVEMVELAVKTMAALHAVHTARIVHRDLSPSNVLLGPDGPRLIDFGVAKVLGRSDSTTLEPMGNPGFMSPEQFGGELIGLSSDIYSWALTILFAAGGYQPVANPDRHVDVSKVSNRLGEFLESCLTKERADRPDTETLWRKMTQSGMAAAHGVPEDTTTTPATLALPEEQAMPVSTVVDVPAWYMRWWLPYPASALITVLLCTIYIGVFRAPLVPVLLASAGELVALFLLLAITLDPARHRSVNLGDARLRKPRHLRSRSG
jgi:serine/threonine protein kinase